MRESILIDLWELEQFYRHSSGGFLMDILYPYDPDGGIESLESVAEHLGFLRKCRIYSLIYRDHMKAVFIVDQSDLAINMSDLLNCIKVLIVDPTMLSSELLSLTVTKRGEVYGLDNVTILLYPASQNVPSVFAYKKSANFGC